MNRLVVFIMALLFAGISVFGQRTTQPGVRISGTHTPGNVVVFGDSGRTLVDGGVGPTNVVYASNIVTLVNGSLQKGAWYDYTGFFGEDEAFVATGSVTNNGIYMLLQNQGGGGFSFGQWAGGVPYTMLAMSTNKFRSLYPAWFDAGINMRGTSITNATDFVTAGGTSLTGLASEVSASNANFQAQIDASDYLDTGSLIARMSSFSTNPADWTTNTTLAVAGVDANGLQMDYYNNGSLSFDGTTATVTCTNDGYQYLRMFVDAKPLRGKKVNLIVEGHSGDNNLLTLTAWTRTGGVVVNSKTHFKQRGTDSDFAYQMQYDVEPDADYIYFGPYQNQLIGDTLVVDRMEIREVKSWEDEPVINAHRLREFADWQAGINSGTLADFDVLMVGDSWTAPDDRLAGQMYSILTNCAPIAEAGWVGLTTYSGGGGLLDDNLGTLTKTGSWVNVFGTVSPDAQGISSTNAGDYVDLQIERYYSDRFLFYYDGTKVGSFRYRTQYRNGPITGSWITDTDWTTNTVTGAGDPWEEIEDAITEAYSKRLEIQTLSGTNLFYGVHCKNESGRKGIAVHKAGKSGARLSLWSDISDGADSAYQRAALVDLDPDLVVICFGTNEQGGYHTVASPADQYAWFESYLDNIYTALGDDTDVLIITPAQNTYYEAVGSMYAYRDAQHLIAQKYDCAYINLIPVFGNDPLDYAHNGDLAYLQDDGSDGDPLNDVHPSAAGLALIKDAIYEALGEPRLPDGGNFVAKVDSAGLYYIGSSDLRELFGATIQVTTNSQMVLPDVNHPRMSFTVKNMNGSTVTVESTKAGSGPAASSTLLDGVQLDGGDKSASTNAGEVITFMVIDPDDWDATSDNWYDGGA